MWRCASGAGCAGRVVGQHVRDVHAILTSAFTRAVVWGVAAGQPGAGSGRAARSSDPSGPRPTVEEVARLLAAALAEERWFGVLLRVAAVAGARRGGRGGLRWSDLDRERGDLLIARGVVAVPGGSCWCGRPRPTRSDGSRLTGHNDAAACAPRAGAGDRAGSRDDAGW